VDVAGAERVSRDAALPNSGKRALWLEGCGIVLDAKRDGSKRSS